MWCLCLQGIILTGFVMACELFPAEMRTVAGTAIENFWALGMCILAGLAYLIRDWKYLQLTISLPAILTVAFYWYVFHLKVKCCTSSSYQLHTFSGPSLHVLYPTSHLADYH